MKRIFKQSFLVFILTTYVLLARAQEITLRQTNLSGIYKKGQKVSVYALPGPRSTDSLYIRVLKNNLKVIEKKAIKSNKDVILVFEGSFKESCSIIVEARMKEVTSSIGFIIDPGRLKPGAVRPNDFESYWNNQKKSLKAMPLDVKTTAVADAATLKGYSCVNIEINCLGPKPVRGYFAKPEKSSQKSLPIVLLVHAAGVKGDWCRSEPKNALEYAKKGALCFDLNAHGMLNGQPESYYVDLENGELKNYMLTGLTNRDNVYFRGMYLRLMRTIDFLTSQPEWDGKRILVIGESQGGGQALVAAGLDHRVSAVVAIVPAMCDWFASSAGRMGGWPRPLDSDAPKEEVSKAIPYFDAANILKGARATIFTEIGLIDMTCPSTSVYSAINQAKGKKIIYAVPYRPHKQQQNSLTKTWEATIYKPRQEFINNYLK